jgi:hypothetical protein
LAQSPSSLGKARPDNEGGDTKRRISDDPAHQIGEPFVQPPAKDAEARFIRRFSVEARRTGTNLPAELQYL